MKKIVKNQKKQIEQEMEEEFKKLIILQDREVPELLEKFSLLYENSQ